MSTVQESILSAVMNKQEWAQQVWEAGITPDHFGAMTVCGSQVRSF